MGLVVPAVLPSSRADLDEKLSLLAKIPSVSRMQIDVVDGQFASPASWPYSAPVELSTMVASGEKLPRLDVIEYEIDLMCIDAERAAGAWLALGASRFTLHTENISDLPALLATVRQRCGIVSIGLAISLASDLSRIEPCLDNVEYVQCMGIAQIGRQGESFDEHVLEQVRALRARHTEIALQVDGGITFEHAKELVALGVTNLVIGSAILRANDPSAAVAEFEALQSSYGV